eukprot:Amastigsp_a509766_44.p5 type:complete len:103 gc:universal Amastigsp_a509766_44:855-1163(+)
MDISSVSLLAEGPETRSLIICARTAASAGPSTDIRPMTTGLMAPSTASRRKSAIEAPPSADLSTRRLPCISCTADAPRSAIAPMTTAKVAAMNAARVYEFGS